MTSCPGWYLSPMQTVDGPAGELTLQINGEARRVPAPASVQALLAYLGLDARAVVVEVNQEIIRRPRLADTPLADGDSIEIVHFVGGG